MPDLNTPQILDPDARMEIFDQLSAGLAAATPCFGLLLKPSQARRLANMMLYPFPDENALSPAHEVTERERRLGIMAQDHAGAAFALQIKASDLIYLVERNAYLRDSLNEALQELGDAEIDLWDPSEVGVEFDGPPRLTNMERANLALSVAEEMLTRLKSGEAVDYALVLKNGIAAETGVSPENIVIEGDVQAVPAKTVLRALDGTKEVVASAPYAVFDRVVIQVDAEAKTLDIDYNGHRIQE